MKEYVTVGNNIQKKENPIAKTVKLADLVHNSDEVRSRAEHCSEEQIEKWRKKYSKAKQILVE